MPSPTPEEELQEAVQRVGEAGRKMRDSLSVRYQRFIAWSMAETVLPPPMALANRVLNTFSPEEVVHIGDPKLAELYEAAMNLRGVAKSQKNDGKEQEQ